MALGFKLLIDRYLGGFLIAIFDPLAYLAGLLFRRSHAPEVRGDILIIKMLGGGSLVMAYPPILALRLAYPDVKLRLFTTPGVRPFAASLGVFDEILVFDDRSLGSLVLSAVKNLARAIGTDTVVDLEIYSRLTTVLSLLTMGRNRFGFFFEDTLKNKRLHTHRMFFHVGSPLYKHYDRVADLLGAPIPEASVCADRIRQTLGAASSASSAPARRVAIGASCSDLARERMLSPDQWRQVFASAGGQDREVLFLGGKVDRDDADAIIDVIDGWKGPLRNTCGEMSLADSLRALLGSDEFWGIDSALLHYARLFGIKTLSFLGPTHPMRLRPIPGLIEDVRYRKIMCSPCAHITSVAPCGGDNRCIQGLFPMPAEREQMHDRWLPVAIGYPNRGNRQTLS